MRSAFFILLFTFLHSNTSYGQLSKPDDYLIRYVDTIKDEAGYKNREGKIVIPAGKYATCYTDTFFTYAIVSIPKKGLIGIDRHENELYKVFIFDNGPDEASNGLFRMIKHGKIGYADVKTGKIVIKPKYGCAWPFDKGTAKVSLECEKIPAGEYTTWKSDLWYRIDTMGNRVWQANEPILYIKQGYSISGFTGSYRIEQTIDSTKIINTRSSSNSKAKTEVRDTISLTKAYWKQMTDSINVEKFSTLPERTGCGSCQDLGDYWIEIATTEKKYRILFEKPDEDIQEILKHLPPLKR
ncbi:MAG: hypothetical protein K0R51_838 [Cytophagaceae bacterium]|jgi:hypothetical protein|nr:hypothetical protein [Cytophagaceae bacterium]